MKKVTKVVNISDNKINYSQRNNKINPSSTCGPTNMMQAIDYAGWELPMWRYPELDQIEDKFTKFCRTDKDVLDYYKKKYPSMYNNWIDDYWQKFSESRETFDCTIDDFRDKYPGEETWKSDFPNSFPPNEVHDVLSYAANKFMGYDGDDPRVTWFSESIEESFIVNQLMMGLPVVGSVKFGNYGHLVTIVGFEYTVPLKYADNKPDEDDFMLDDITNYIIDNTYGRFNFDTMKYDAVSGNDEKIERNRFLSMLKPIGSDRYMAHFFIKGPTTI